MTKVEASSWLDEIIEFKTSLRKSFRSKEPEIFVMSDDECIMIYQGIEKLAEILEENLTIIPYGDGYVKIFFKYKGIEVMQIGRTE